MKLMLYTVKNQKHSYKNIGYVGLKNGKRTNIKILSLGNSEQIEKLNENYKKVIDNIICDYDEKVNPELLKNLIMTSLNKPTYKNIKINAGVDVIEKFIDKLNLLKDFNYGKHKGMKEIIKYSMANKISNPSSILNSYYKRDLSGLDLDYSKNSFYRMLNLLLNNKNTLLKNIEKIRINNST
ncbi:hypothetical protein, partial [Mycoplasma leonicaptivi]|uniref:hypothetical protein n=1 Tax=Mycoplasma leonicaptivi TaxID=36742 RepID=UPI00055B21BA